MLKIALLYIILWLLFQIFGINCQTPFRPVPRSLHTATLIGDKLYILGGIGGGKDFFYLDIPASFTNKQLVWIDLSSINIVPSHSGAASVTGGINNSTLFLYGVLSTSMKLVYTFNSGSMTWSIQMT